MSVIGRQSIKASVFIYVGFAIGALNILVLFPNEKYFTLAEFGLTKVLVDVSLLIAMLCTLGTAPAVVKFYPFYNSYLPKQKNDLPFITTFTVIVGCTLFCVITPFFKEIVIRKFGQRSPLFVEDFNLIYPLTVSMAFLYLYESYAWAVRKTVLPAFARELLVRMLTTFLIVLVMLHVLNFNQFINLYSLIYLPPALFVLFVLLKSGDLVFHFKISSVTRRLKNRLLIFSLFIFSGQVLNILARTLDSIIISSQSKGGLNDTGLFTVATYLVAVMEVPIRGMTGIAFSVLAQAWKDKNTKKVYEVYKKTALNLLIAGLFILGLIILNIQNLVTILGSKYRPMIPVVFILGFSKLIDLGTGLNSQLLLASKRWKIEFVTNIFLVCMAGVFNYLLVRQLGIVGSAFATLIAFSVYNSVRFLLIWKFFNMQPFDFTNLKAILIAGISFFIAWIIPYVSTIFFDIIVRSSIFVLFFAVLMFSTNISPDINNYCRGFLKRLNIKL